MSSEIKDSSQEEISVIKNEKIEKPLDLETAVLEVEKLIKEIEEHCQELTCKLSEEGKEVEVSSKDVKDFQAKDRKIVKNNG